MRGGMQLSGCGRVNFAISPLSKDGENPGLISGFVKEDSPPPHRFRRNVPFRYSSNACRSSSCVFITMGPRHAIGS